MTRGEIYWADYGVPFGSEAGFRRPVVIVQDNNFNIKELRTVVVVPLTTNLLLAEYKDNILLEKAITKLKQDSVALIPQIGSVDKSCLVEKIAKLSPAKMLEISHALSDLLTI